jgi:hypothetical protein
MVPKAVTFPRTLGIGFLAGGYLETRKLGNEIVPRHFDGLRVVIPRPVEKCDPIKGFTLRHV